MQFPESWLRAYCNPPLSTQQLADTLTMGGLEVEELRPVAPAFSNIVVGEILSATQHPNADRLRVCQVDAGQGGAPLTIVCGAPNARAGIRVPCARIGAELPPGEDGKPFVIKPTKLRGVESQGMLCSARELRLSDDHGGLLELQADAPVGQNVRQLLNLDDTLFTLKLTPNLAHCLGVLGVARELAALTGAPLQPPQYPAMPVHDAADVLPVRVLATDLCGRFSGRIIRGVNPKASTPAWMVERLARCGQRSVSALVDISNYVMFEFGRPTHIFDLDKIHGGLDVRWARAGETLKLLNGTTVTLDEQVGVIADTQAVESLAGIMGGDATAVSDDTRNIYVEAAFWWPRAIAGRSRRFNFATDAGHRFERGVDPDLTVEHIERITQLILEICGEPHSRCGPVDDQQPAMPQPAPVHLRVARAAKVLGMPVTQAQCVQALRRLGLPVTESDGTITVQPPRYRFDLQLEEDLIEEVARLTGYDTLPDTAPLAPIVPCVRPEHERNAFALRRSLAALGYQETINFSFVDERGERDLCGNPDPLRLLNPLSSQLGVMRSSLMPSLLQVLRYNLNRRANRVRVFEFGRVFLRDARVADSLGTVAGVHQPMRVAALAHGPVSSLQWGERDRAVDFFDLKGDLENLLTPALLQLQATQHPAMHPGRCARVLLDGHDVGLIGELHPRWVQELELGQAPVLFEVELDAVLRRSVPAFGGVPKFQAMERDLAVLVDESVSSDAIVVAVRDADTGSLLRDVLPFDIYRAKDGSMAGRKSVALRLTLGSDAATLSDEQGEACVQAVLQNLQLRLGAQLRT